LGGLSRFLRTTVVRLAAIYVVVFSIAVGALLAGVYAWSVTVIDGETDGLIQAELQGLAEQYDRLGLRGLASVIRDRSEGPSRTRSVYLLADPGLRRIAGNLAAWPPSARQAGQWFEFEIDVRTGTGVERHPIRAGLFLLPGEYRLLVGTDVVERVRFKSLMGRIGAWSVLLVVVLGSGIGIWMNRRLLAQVNRIAAAGREIADGDLAQRLPVRGTGDELDVLAVGLNRLLDRIEQLTLALRFVIDGTAHDLRGPLGRLRQRLERAGEQPDARAAMAAAAIADIETLQKTLDSLLRIAQAQSGAMGAELTSLSLGNLAREMLDLYAPVASERGIRLEPGRLDDGMIRGSRQLLAHALANLIDNALKYTTRGATVSVAVIATGDDVELTVADNGPGIAPEDRARVLERFVRSSSARAEPGTGLGLSLVAAVARLHDAALALDDNEPGLRVRLRFTATPAAGA